MLHIVSRSSEAAVIAAARRSSAASGGRAVVGREQRRPLVGRHAGVGGEAAEVEERRVEAGILPVDEPEPVAVVDEVGGQKVVVPEDDLDRPGRRLQPLGRRREAREVA